MIGCDGLMKAPYLLVTSCLVFYLASCDLGVEPDPVEEEEGAEETKKKCIVA